MTASQITFKCIRTFYLLLAEGCKYTLAKSIVKIMQEKKQKMQ